MKAAIYTRVSTEDQVKEGYSLAVQKEQLLEHIKREGWKFYREYKDDGISGYTNNRPGLKRLLYDASNKKFDVVLVYKIDRFSRRLKDLIFAVDELAESGVSFKSATEPFDTTTSAGNLMFQQLGSFAEFERNRIKERVFPGMVKGVQAGNWQGARYSPYGYRYDKKNKLLIVVPDEAAVVRTIYTMYLTGQTTSMITSYLYKKQYKTRTGKRFHSKLVCDILKNKIYTGKLVWNRRHYNKKEKTRGGFGKGNRYLPGDPSSIVESQGRHEAIISGEDFNRVQTRLASQRKGKQRVFNKHSHLLTGILVCSNCDSRFIGYTNVSNHKTGARKKWYRCRLKQETKSLECSSKNVLAAQCDNFAFVILDKIILHKFIHKKRYENLIKVTADPTDEITIEISKAKKSLRENHEKQNRLTKLYLDRDIKEKVYRDQQHPLKQNEEKIEQKIKGLEMKLIEKEDSRDYNNLLHSVLENFSHTKEPLTIGEKKALLRLIFKKILVSDGKIVGYELYEPFKTLLAEAEVECQFKKLQKETERPDLVCTYALSDVR